MGEIIHLHTQPDIFGGVTSLSLMDAAERDRRLRDDRELVVLAERLERLDRRRKAIALALDSDQITRFEMRQLQSASDDVTTQWYDVLADVSDRPAFTEVGLAAKAKVTLLALSDPEPGESTLSASLAADVLARFAS